MTRARQFVDRYATRLRGAPFALDERIPARSLAGVVADRATMRLRGILRFPRRRGLLVGRRVVVRSAPLLHTGAGVILGHGALVDALSTEGVWLADRVSVGRNTRIECTGSLRSLGTGLRVGHDAGLGTDCFYGCAGGVSIGADTIVGNFVSFHSENHVTDDLTTPIRLQGVVRAGIEVGADCWIGAKVTVLDGARIGDGCIVAAGSVVTAGDYPPRGVYGGVPARRLKDRA